MPSSTTRSASDFIIPDETEHHNPTIPELFSPLRDSFQTADFDRVQNALISREAKLKRRNSILREAVEFEKLEALRLAEELNALKKERPPLKKKKKEEVSDEGKDVIWQLRKENRRLETERSFLERECEALESRIVALEDDTLRLINEMFKGSNMLEDRIHNGGGVNLETVFDSLIAAHKNGALQIPGREAKLDRVIQKQREEFVKLEKEHKFEMQKMQKVESEYATLQKKHQLQLKERDSVENELKGCRAEMERLKEELNVMEEKHRREYVENEHKHQFSRLEMLKVETEVKGLREERKVLEEKHQNQYKALERKHQSDCLEMLKVENELKVCKADLDELKEERKVLEEKHQNEYKALERKHQSHLLEVENELKHCKAELVALKEEKNISNEKYEKLLQEVNKRRKDEDEVVIVKEEKDISNEKYEKLLEVVNKHKKDEDEVFNFGSQKNKEVKSEPKYLELENEISRLDKYMNELKHLGLKNMDKRSKNNKMTDVSRKQKSIPDPKHVTNVEHLYDSVPANANASPRGNGVGNSGTSKSSPEAPILLSDSDDDCAPRETKSFGLKRKRASSPNASDDNNCGHKFEQESFPTAENKQSRILRHCGSLVSKIGKQNNPSSCDEENLRPFEEKVGEKQKSEDVSSTKVNFESDSSSSFSFSSDDSKEDDDINLESLMLFKTNRP